jgi:thioesterase domain-containing protein
MPDSHLVPLRTQGSLAPLVLFPPVGGSPEMYVELTRLLPSAQPVHTAHLIGTQGEIDLNSSLPELAKVYVDEIRRTFPSASLRLGGHSSGGHMAFEVARQLEALGHTIDRVILFDSLLPQKPSHFPASRVPAWRASARLGLRAWQLAYGHRFPGLLPGLLKLKRHMRALLPAGARMSASPPHRQAPLQPTDSSSGAISNGSCAPLSFAGLLQWLDKVEPTLTLEGRQAMQHLLRDFPSLVPSQRRERLYQFLEAHTESPDLASPNLPSALRRKIARSSFVLLESLGSYRPVNPIRATVILLKATEETRSADLDHQNWAPLSMGEFVCVAVPGNHMSMMHRPALDTVIERLWPLIDHATSRAAPVIL